MKTKREVISFKKSEIDRFEYIAQIQFTHTPNWFEKKLESKKSKKLKSI